MTLNCVVSSAETIKTDPSKTFVVSIEKLIFTDIEGLGFDLGVAIVIQIDCFSNAAVPFH